LWSIRFVNFLKVDKSLGFIKFDYERGKGYIFIDEDVPVEKLPRLTLNDFSFAKSRKLLKDVKGSLSDAVIEERRSYL